MNAKKKFKVYLGFWQIILVSGIVFVISFAQKASAAMVEGSPVQAAAEISSADVGKIALAASISISCSTIAAAIAIKTTGTAAISMLTENEAGFFKAFLIVALAEALAIYGLIISILLWLKIP